MESPHQFRVDSLHDEFEFKYGYWQPTAPDGGPQVMAQAMADKFLGQGEILLETEFLSSTPSESEKKKIHTSRGDLYCRYLVNTTAHTDYYPETFAHGLPISMYWLVLDKKFHYPSGVHTSIYYPENISYWFSMLENGQLPEQFGFHVFKSDLPEKTDHYTANLYFYLPRGCESPDAQVLQRVESFLFPALEQMLPGIGAAIRVRYFVSPDDFARRHTLSSRVLPVITPCSYPKPPNYCAEQDIYYAGAAYFPPGDHASAAVLSGAIVAKLISQTQTRTAAATVISEQAKFGLADLESSP